jgi:O-succinylbenzoic acid--CoA ligase
VNLSLNEEQVICIRSKSLFRGYFPEDAERSEYETDDIGRWVTDDLIEILGRRDFIINTGGEKVNPEEVEASLASLLPGVAVAVGAKADAQWGEAVVALVESPLSREQVEQLISKLSATLAPYKVPKEILTGVEVPRSSLGKVNRAAVRCYLSEK